MILLGMIADLSDECTMVTLLMDCEIFGVGNVWSELDAFHLRIEHLFVKGKALSTGCRRLELAHLRRQRIIEVPGMCFAEPWLQIRRWGNQHHTRAGPDGQFCAGGA